MNGRMDMEVDPEIAAEALAVVRAYRADLELSEQQSLIANSACGVVLNIVAMFIKAAREQEKNYDDVVAGVKAGIAMALKALQDSRIAKP